MTEERTYRTRIGYAWDATRRPVERMLKKEHAFGKALGIGMAAVSPLSFAITYGDSFFALDKTAHGYVERD